MAFNNVKNFLDSSNDLSVLAEYDLKNEMQYCNNSSLEKALDYKVSNNGFDCDGSLGKNTCKLIREVYRILWGWRDLNNDGSVKRYAETDLFGDFLMGPETMNSFWTSFGAFMSNKEIINIDKYIWKNNTLKFKTKMTKQQRLTKIYNEATTDIERNCEHKELIENFSNAVGRIGNMILTFAGFNKNIANDYWDIKIDNQYLSNNLISSLCKRKYVNVLFQWDYVKVNKNEYFYKPFYNNHNFKNSFPEKKEDILLYLKKVDALTKRRGFFMVAMLKITRENSNLYKEIQSKVFSTDKVYSGYAQVFGEILKLDNVIKNNEIKELLEKAQEKIDEIKVD